MTQSEKTSICIVLGTAHGADVAGKRSPDDTLKEYQFSREMCTKIQKQLQEEGYRCIIDSMDVNEIGLGNRVQICNNYAKYFGIQNTLYFSIHVNAAGADGKWHNATGWESHIAKNASEKSKKIADLVFYEIEKQGIKTRKPTPKQKYWTSDFYVLKNTLCPAILVETMFQDNKEDVKFLLSREGKEKIKDAYCNALKAYVDEIRVK